MGLWKIIHCRCPNYSRLTGHTRSFCTFFEIPSSGLRMPPQVPAICAASAVNVHAVRPRISLDSDSYLLWWLVCRRLGLACLIFIQSNISSRLLNSTPWRINRAMKQKLPTVNLPIDQRRGGMSRPPPTSCGREQ